MTNHEIVQETVIFNGERVDYQDWLKDPVFKASWWSPAGAHVEALSQIGRGEDVSKEVIKALMEGPDPSRMIWETIKLWNGLEQSQKDENEASATETLMERVIETYQNNLKMNVMFYRYNPQGATAVDGKREILRSAVQLRSGVPKS